MIEVMKQALEYIKDIYDHCSVEGIEADKEEALVQSLRQAIQEATLQEISDIGQEIEPVAYLMDGELFTAAEYQAIAEQGDGAQPLYTAPPKRKWVGLTDEEIDYIWGISPADYEDKFAFPRAIEAKLKENNT